MGRSVSNPPLPVCWHFSTISQNIGMNIVHRGSEKLFKKWKMTDVTINDKPMPQELRAFHQVGILHLTEAGKIGYGREIEFPVLETFYKSHESKEHAILHRNRYPTFSLSPPELGDRSV